MFTHIYTQIHNIICPYSYPIHVHIRGYVYGSYKTMLLVYSIYTVSSRLAIVYQIYIYIYAILSLIGITYETALNIEKTNKVNTMQTLYSERFDENRR